MKKYIFLLSSIFFPLISFYIVLWLYNTWFDTWDRIKYDPFYSPEFDQSKIFENIIYWLIIFLSIMFEFFLIYKYQKEKTDKIK